MPFVIGKSGSAGLRLMLVTLVVLVAAGGGLAAAPTGRAQHREPPAYAVIYARARSLATTNNDAIDLYWQSLPSGTPRVSYTTPRSADYLPSPDGRWLYVWHNPNDAEGLPTATRFFLVSIPDAKVVPVAEAKAYPSSGYGRFVLTLAPVWQLKRMSAMAHLSKRNAVVASLNSATASQW